MEGQSTSGEEFRWSNSKFAPKTQRILGAAVGVLLIATIALTHTSLLASIRYSVLYYLLYFFLIIIIINLFFTRRSYIIINSHRLQVQMPRFGERGDQDLPTPGKTVLLDLPWVEIQQIKMSDRKVTLTLQNEVIKEFPLVYLSHRASQKLKKTLRLLAKSHGVPVRMKE